MSPNYIEVNNYIEGNSSDLKSTELFRFREELKTEIPSTIDYFIRDIDLALSKQIPFTKHGLAANVYSIMNTGRPSCYNYLVAVEAVKWLMKDNTQEAGDLCFEKIEEILYYSGRVPLISSFYDAIALHQFKQE